MPCCLPCCRRRGAPQLAQVKRRKEGGGEAAAAQRRAQQLLRDFAAMPLAEMQPEAALQQLQAMYRQLEGEAAADPALSILLAEAAA